MYQLSSQKPDILLDDILNVTHTEESIKNFKKQSYQRSLMMSTIRRDGSSELDSDEEQDDKELISALDSNKLIRGLAGNAQGSSSYMTKTPSISASESDEEGSANKKLDNYIKNTRDTFSDYYSKIQKDKELEEMRNKLKNIGDDSEEEKENQNGYSIERFSDNITPIKPNLNMTNFSFLDNSKKKTSNLRKSASSEQNNDLISIGDIKPKIVQNDNKLNLEALNKDVIEVVKAKKPGESSLNINTQLTKLRSNNQKPIENIYLKDQQKNRLLENHELTNDENQINVINNKEDKEEQINIETGAKIKDIVKNTKNKKNQKIFNIENKKNDINAIKMDINLDNKLVSKTISKDKTPISIFNESSEKVSIAEYPQNPKNKDTVENKHKIDKTNDISSPEEESKKDMFSDKQTNQNKLGKNKNKDNGLKGEKEVHKSKSEKVRKKEDLVVDNSNNDIKKTKSSPLHKMEIENNNDNNDNNDNNNFDDVMSYIQYDQPEINLSPMKELRDSSIRRAELPTEKVSEPPKKKTSKSPISKSPKMPSKSPKKSLQSPKKVALNEQNPPSTDKIDNSKNKQKKKTKLDENKVIQEVQKNDDDTLLKSPEKIVIKKKVYPKRKLNKIKEVAEIEEATDGNNNDIARNKTQKPRLKSIKKRKREDMTTRQKYLELYDRALGGKYSHIIEKQIDIKHEYFGPNQRYPRRSRVQTMCFWRNEKPIYMNRGEGIQMVGLQFMDEELYRFKALIHDSDNDKSDEEPMPILKRLKVILL